MAPCNSVVVFSVAVFYTALAENKRSRSSCKVTQGTELSELHGPQMLQRQTQEDGSKGGKLLVPGLKQQLVEVQETKPCVWGRPHNVQSRHDKPLCEDGVFSWKCKSGGHGHRLQCPAQTPTMCADISCDGGLDYCCEKDCASKGGPRPADNCEASDTTGCDLSVPVDLIFLVDSSGSMKKEGFDQCRQYLREVVKRMPVDGSNATSQIGIAQFSTKSFESIDIPSLEGVTQESVSAAIDKMEWHKLHYKNLNDPMTHTGEALQYVLDHMFPKVPGGRGEMLVLITDGQSNGIINPADAAAVARKNGIQVVAVGVHNYADEAMKQRMKSELNGIVGGDKDKILSVDQYSELLTIVENTTKMICTYAEPAPTPTPFPTVNHGDDSITPRQTDSDGHNPPKPTPSPTVNPRDDSITPRQTDRDGHNPPKPTAFPTVNPNPPPCLWCVFPSVSVCLCVCACVCVCLPKPPTDGLDMIFLLNGSSSMGTKGFDQSRMFLKKVAKHLPLDQGNVGTRVAIVQFSDVGKESVEIPLADGVTFDKVEDAVNAMKWHGTLTHDLMTHTGEAIEYVLDHVLPTSVPGIPHMLALITDGVANGKKDPAAVAAKAREMGIEIVAIGVGLCDYDELIKVTGDKSKVLAVKSPSELLSIVDETAELVCKSAVANST